MECKVVQGEIEKLPVDTIISSLFEGVQEPGGATGSIDRSINGLIRELISSGDITGKLGSVSVIYPRGLIPANRVLLVGLGKRDNLDMENIRIASAQAIKKARELNAKDVATVIHGSGSGGFSHAAASQAVIEGSLLGIYRFDQLKSSEETGADINTLTLVEFDPTKLAEVHTSVTNTQKIIQGVFLTRDLVNLPPNMATPTHLAQTAQQIADEFDMKITIGDREWAKNNRMGAYLGVAKGAGEPPKFIIMEHNSSREDLETIVLVGKGITFDTGGISIKPSEKMEEMKTDMAGAAAVIGTMKVVGMLNLPLRIIAITPCTENMPDAQAYRPADVITASNGKTIEIISTDAEGRLILADALVYAKKYAPKAVIDLATLTGACVVALGKNTAAGMFCNDNTLSDKLSRSGDKTHERVWPLPLWDEYRKNIESNVADIKNSGGRNSGVSSSAIFLKEFIDYPWAHLDIAGMALSEKDEGYTPLGGTGYGVRLLVDLLQNW